MTQKCPGTDGSDSQKKNNRETSEPYNRIVLKADRYCILDTIFLGELDRCRAGCLLLSNDERRYSAGTSALQCFFFRGVHY
ncbi:unnamed protein product, partial [Ectocarpus sp. 12 AP-2014]